MVSVGLLPPGSRAGRDEDNEAIQLGKSKCLSHVEPHFTTGTGRIDSDGIFVTRLWWGNTPAPKVCWSHLAWRYHRCM